MKNVLKNDGKSSVPKVIKMGDFDKKCQGDTTVKSRPTCVKQNATLILNAPVKPLSNNSDVIAHDSRKEKSISVKKGQQNVFNQKKLGF